MPKSPYNVLHYAPNTPYKLFIFRGTLYFFLLKRSSAAAACLLFIIIIMTIIYNNI